MPHETAADLARQDPSDEEAVEFLPGATSGRLPEDKMERAEEIAGDALAKAKKNRQPVGAGGNRPRQFGPRIP